MPTIEEKRKQVEMVTGFAFDTIEKLEGIARNLLSLEVPIDTVIEVLEGTKKNKAREIRVNFYDLSTIVTIHALKGDKEDSDKITSISINIDIFDRYADVAYEIRKEVSLYA